MKHISARMAWHDRRWDAHVCDNPAENTYCVGSHSLLSERLAREKKTRVEETLRSQPLDAKLEDDDPYLPPCFYTSCAFSEIQTKIVHRHPFLRYKDSKQIADALAPYSVYTWPFRLSITQSQKASKKYGQYFPDIEGRIERFCGALVPKRSLIFFYLNYDNPVSGDDYKYALVGCARLSRVQLTGSFEFTAKELTEIRSADGMQHFPTLNWAIQLSHAGPGQFVRLPYQEYLSHIQEHPEEERKLEEMRVLVDEPALLPGCKYVSELLNYDQGLALLYKLKRSIAMVEDHGIVNVEQEKATLDQFIEEGWLARGLYPGLSSVVSVLAGLAEGDPIAESSDGEFFVDAVRKQLKADEDLLEQTFSILQSKGAISEYLAPFKTLIRDSRAGLRDNNHLLPIFKKLSLFALTPRQIARSIFPKIDGPHALGGLDVAVDDLAKNPYLLAEAYVPATSDEVAEREDRDKEQRTDGAIDYFTIDIGMFPDKRYVQPNDSLQDLTVAGPERLRSFVVEALQRNEDIGNTFAPVTQLVEYAERHPLFYRDRLALTVDHFTSDEHLRFFQERAHVEVADGAYYFYLKATKKAEDIVCRYVSDRLCGRDLQIDLQWVDTHISMQAKLLADKISDFDTSLFIEERQRLMQGALTRPFFCITGRPGSGKTQALRDTLDHLCFLGESTTVLAPTGKAALRLTGNADADQKWRAETIDRWISRSGLFDYASGKKSLASMTKSSSYADTDNLIIDEMSMVDLHKLALLFRALEVHQPGTVKRVILVGDENQLPPIGSGRPFYDIITSLREDIDREKRFLVRLTTNCRQRHDATVLDAAHIFAGKNRYHSELFGQLLKGGSISDYLTIKYWESPEQLQLFLLDFVEDILKREIPNRNSLSPEQAFNLLLNLYENGYVPHNRTSELRLDRVQVLAPYRGGRSGSLGVSEFIRSVYRRSSWPRGRYKSDSGFAHSDKIIRITNKYGWNKKDSCRELQLSNGSIGVLCDNKRGRCAYFPEQEYSLDWERMDEEDFELAYGITVHKAQGSEFEEVAVVLPERRALLCRELVYTALTRSKGRLALFIQKTPRENPLAIARQRSVLLSRNSSVFSRPYDSRKMFEPEPGIKVQSKIEYLIYTTLRKARDQGQLSFAYEREMTLPIEGRLVTVHPDFTIVCQGNTYYWEHLGMLDREDYSRDWNKRLGGYEVANLLEMLVTTDDLGGVKQSNLDGVIQDVLTGKLRKSSDALSFSRHHYCL